MSVRIGVVTGLRAEARALGRARADPGTAPMLFCAGGSGRRAYEAARAFVDQGAGGLVSFGIAGGLAPGLPTGAVVLADAVITPEGGQLATSKSWRARLKTRLAPLSVYEAPIAGVERIVATPEDKASLCVATGALAVDMESHGVARAAQAADVPFLVVRVVSDPLQQPVPWSALAGMADDGGMRIWPVLGRLAARPWELPALLRLRGNSRAALRVLGRVAAVDPLALGFV